MELKHLNLYFTRKLCTSSTIIKRMNPKNIDEDGCTWVEVNNQKKAIGYGEEGIKSTIISDNNGNYCIGIAIHYDNDTRISEFYKLNKENIVYMSAVDGYIKSAYQDLGLYVEDRNIS